MEVKQIYELVNTATTETLGESALVQEDLGNIVDIGAQIFNAEAVDRYVKSLINHIGRVVFVNRPYSGAVPSLLMDAWEFGSVMEKVQCELPEATENESWQLESGASYDPNIFTAPQVSATFYNSMTTFEIPMSFTQKQVKQSFSNVEQLNAFTSMLYNAVDRSMTIKLDSLIMRTLNNMIGETIYDDFGANSISGGSHIKAVNLLYLFNHKYYGDTSANYITAADACTNPDFIRFASYTMGLYEARLRRISSLFNVDGKPRFTPTDYLRVVLLADFAKGAEAFLQSDTFHNQFTALPGADIVPYWQGSGTGYGFADTSKVYIETSSGHEVTATGVLGIMFDRDACGVANMDRRVTSNFNPKAEFYNNWYKWDARYFNSLQENFVVFFAA